MIPSKLLSAEIQAAADANDDDKVRLLVESSITRKCGHCTGCCTALGVEEIGKADQERCRHELPRKGCAIYADRPKQCANFYCFWRLGLGARKDAPDQTGVVLDGYRDELGRAVLRAAEMHTGAMSPSTRGRAFADSLLNGFNYMLILRRDGTQEIVGL